MTPIPLWTLSPERARASNFAHYLESLGRTQSLRLESYEALHRWSIDQLETFWGSIWDH